MLAPAAERLASEYPAAASLRYRWPAESILARDSGKQYGYAARDVRRLAGQVVDEGGIEGYDAL